MCNSSPPSLTDIDDRTARMIVWLRDNDEIVKRMAQGSVTFHIGNEHISPKVVIEKTQPATQQTE